ncbi:uncharacterized protein LOC110821731 isoform X2 [Carica papaya]|uniref:uncharacterized protein LOC110821731 isoform X2 n=1 Tax=Carica papaya TaxID=3649 RepID=UPI000B8CB9DD|nr:uncharacterized protein LOC110821731 isoform X2 [Carica papaya]
MEETETGSDGMNKYGAGKTQNQNRLSLKNQSRFNKYSIWKDKLRENCYRRVREDRTSLLWKMRSPTSQSLDHKDLIKSAFQNIVSDELKKIKDSSLAECLEISTSTPHTDDMLWEYDGLHSAHEGECEEILLEMQRIFYEDLGAEPTRKEPDNLVGTWEDEEDEYLARAVYENMQLNDEQTWCPICKRGELQENHRLIFCTVCELQLNKDNEVNLDALRDRLAEALAEHFEKGCSLKPRFCIETRFNITALYIFCEGCSIFEIIV